MKYWWLKRYKDLKIKLIPELTRQVNDILVMPNNYKERYQVIKNIDINYLEEEDLLIYLYCLLNFDKIKNNKIVLIIENLLKIPDNSMPSTNYTLYEMLEDISKIKQLKQTEDKLYQNNVCGCFNCYNVFYVDKIKYVDKKGRLLCPYCKKHELYFDNDFMPMDYNYLHLANMYYNYTKLGCNFKNLVKIIKKSLNIKLDDISNYKDGAIFIKKDIDEDDIILNDNNITFYMKEIKMKKDITTKEERKIEIIFKRYLNIVKNNLIREIYIDSSIIVSDRRYANNLTLLLTLINELGNNEYLKNITIVCKNEEEYHIYKEMYNNIVNYK